MRTIHPERLAAWRAWYVAVLPLLEPSDRRRSPQAWSTAQHFDIFTSWLLLARSIAFPLNPAAVLPRPDDRIMGVRDASGAPWIISPPAAAARGRWSVGTDAEGRELLLPPRDWCARWPRAWLVHRVDDIHGRGRVLLRGLRAWGASPRTGARFRSGPRARVVVRALLVRGLVEDGMSQGAAVRLWLSWDKELGGPLTRSVPPTVLAAAQRIAARPRGSRHLGQSARDARFADRTTWRDWESGLRREHRRLWRRIGLVAGDGSPLVPVVCHP